MRRGDPARRPPLRHRPARVAIGGISMGGFGAYDLALQHPGRFCAVGGHSAALWFEGGETAPGAFDERRRLRAQRRGRGRRGRPRTPSATPGSGTTTATKTRSAATTKASSTRCEAGDADLSAHTWPGGHEGAYWDAPLARLPALLRQRPGPLRLVRSSFVALGRERTNTRDQPPGEPAGGRAGRRRRAPAFAAVGLRDRDPRAGHRRSVEGDVGDRLDPREHLADRALAALEAPLVQVGGEPGRRRSRPRRPETAPAACGSPG